MIDTYTGIATNLFSYREFYGLFMIFRGFLWLALAAVIIMLVLHVFYMLGYQTPLYSKRSPSARARKAFVRGSMSVGISILLVLAGCEWLDSNIVVDHERQSVIHW